MTASFNEEPPTTSVIFLRPPFTFNAGEPVRFATCTDRKWVRDADETEDDFTSRIRNELSSEPGMGLLPYCLVELGNMEH